MTVLDKGQKADQSSKKNTHGSGMEMMGDPVSSLAGDMLEIQAHTF